MTRKLIGFLPGNNGPNKCVWEIILAAVLTVQQCRLLSFLKSHRHFILWWISLSLTGSLENAPPEESLFHSFCTTQPGQVFEPQELESPWKFFHMKPVFSKMVKEIRFVLEVTCYPFCTPHLGLRSCSSLAVLGFYLDTHALGIVLNSELVQNRRFCVSFKSVWQPVNLIISPECLSLSSFLCIIHVVTESFCFNALKYRSDPKQAPWPSTWKALPIHRSLEWCAPSIDWALFPPFVFRSSTYKSRERWHL